MELKLRSNADGLQDRLVNVVAHEYCHLATFMISGVKDNPHGKEFKEWCGILSLALCNQ